MNKCSSLHFNNTKKNNRWEQPCPDVYQYIFRNALIRYFSFEIFWSEKQMFFFYLFFDTCVISYLKNYTEIHNAITIVYVIF